MRDEEQLRQLIFKKDDELDKEQSSRVIKTFLVLSICIYLIALYLGYEFKMIDIKYCLYWLVLAPISAIIVLIISYGILCYIISGAMNRSSTIGELKGELNAIKYNKRNNNDNLE